MVAKGTCQAKEVGAQRSYPLFLCLSCCYKDLPNVLRVENCILILGFLRYPQPCSAQMADLENWFSAEQIELYFVLDHWQPGWVLTALGPVKPETKSGTFYGNVKACFLIQTYRLQTRRAWEPFQLTVCLGTPRLRSNPTNVPQLILCGTDITLGCSPGL